MAKTIVFSENKKGWTSEFSYDPGLMCRLNNRFFTIKDGQLYKHNSETAPRSNFYGVQYPSKVVKVFNESPKDDKIFKTVVTESDNPWKITLRTNLTNGSIDKTEFNNRESRWFASIKRNESASDLNGVSQGIGRIQDIQGDNIEFNNISETVSVGDKLYQMNGNVQEEIGDIINISDDGIITVSGIVETPINGMFCFGKKDSRINGAAIRGYYMEVTMEDDSGSSNELFGVSTNAIKSYL